MRESLENIFWQFCYSPNCFLAINYPNLILSCTCTHYTHIPSLRIMLNEMGMSPNFFNLRGKTYSMKFIKFSNCPCCTSKEITIMSFLDKVRGHTFDMLSLRKHFLMVPSLYLTEMIATTWIRICLVFVRQLPYKVHVCVAQFCFPQPNMELSPLYVDAQLIFVNELMNQQILSYVTFVHLLRLKHGHVEAR